MELDLSLADIGSACLTSISPVRNALHTNRMLYNLVCMSDYR